MRRAPVPASPHPFPRRCRVAATVTRIPGRTATPTPMPIRHPSGWTPSGGCRAAEKRVASASGHRRPTGARGEPLETSRQRHLRAARAGLRQGAGAEGRASSAERTGTQRSLPGQARGIADALPGSAGASSLVRGQLVQPLEAGLCVLVTRGASHAGHDGGEGTPGPDAPSPAAVPADLPAPWAGEPAAHRQPGQCAARGRMMDRRVLIPCKPSRTVVAPLRPVTASLKKRALALFDFRF